MLAGMEIRKQIRCPSCQGVLVPVELHCRACDVSVRGVFPANEFATLSEEDLHFLRIFVLCEGRIRDMESALGVSYPTIKARLAKLKEALAAQVQAVPPAPVSDPGDPVEGTLRALEAGSLSYDQALQRLKHIPRA